ncbi:MAG TPA: nucleotidyltransferase domain-containing protein [archaeon]|nr:nucleotidyltransferase domain-containing protein [archaeon]
MLKIINDLSVFIEDCYRRINVREYARIMGISAPTASKLLVYYSKEGLLKKGNYRNYILFYANKNSRDFIDLSRIYWRHILNRLTESMEKKLVNPTIILFGSLSKAESKKNSDIDIAVFAEKKEIDISDFEKKLKRKIEIFWFASLNDVKSKELLNNIKNGYVLAGRL